MKEMFSFLACLYMFALSIVCIKSFAYYFNIEDLGDPFIHLRAFVMLSSFIAGWLQFKHLNILLVILFLNLFLCFAYGALPITFVIGYLFGIFYRKSKL